MRLAPLFAEGWLIASHALIALAALVLGAAQLVLPKGTALHRGIGHAWVGAMLIVALGSFWISTIRTVGPFSPIHLLSVVTLVTLVYAVRAARRGDIAGHRIAMVSLFLGALAINFWFTLLPGRAMHEVVFGTG